MKGRHEWEKERETTGIGERETGMRKGEKERERERERQGWERKIEISSCKNKEYKKAKSFIWMF